MNITDMNDPLVKLAIGKKISHPVETPALSQDQAGSAKVHAKFYSEGFSGKEVEEGNGGELKS